MKTGKFLLLNLLFTVHCSLAQQYGWVNLSSNIPQLYNLHDVHFIGDTGWIVGGNARVLITSDGGQSFTTQYLPDNAGITFSIFMRSSTEGYLVTSTGAIYHSTDARNGKWTEIENIGSTLYSICFPPAPATSGYTCGNAGRIWSITGDKVTFSTNVWTYTLTSICFPETANEGWVAGEILYYFKDGNWSDNFEAPGANYYNSIYLTDNSHGWAVGGSGKIIYTLNGFHWNGQANTNENNLNDVFFINNNEGWAVGQEVLLHTTNGGSTWKQEAQDLTAGIIFNSVFATDNHHVYVAGNNGTLLKYTLLTGFDKFAHAPDYMLEQNHPNPFSKTTTISWNCAKSNHQTLKVFDVFGNAVATLVDGFRTSGRQIVDFEIKGLPEGVYFYQLQADGKVETKKMTVSR